MQRANSFHYENKVLTVSIKSIFVVVSLMIFIVSPCHLDLDQEHLLHIGCLLDNIHHVIDYKPPPQRLGASPAMARCVEESEDEVT